MTDGDTVAVQQADDDLLVYDVDRAVTAWILCEAGTMEVRE